MNKKEHHQDISNSLSGKDKELNEYELLIIKLKNIKENITLLENKFFSK